MAIMAQNQLTEKVEIVPLINEPAAGMAGSPAFGRRWFSREVLEIAADALRFVDIIEIILVYIIRNKNDNDNKIKSYNI